MNESTLVELKRWLPRPPVLAAWIVLSALLIWSYNSAFYMMIEAWWRQPDYNHGFFVPIFALVLLLMRGEMISGQPENGTWWQYLLRGKPSLVAGLSSSPIVWIGVAVGGTLGVLLFWLNCWEEAPFTISRAVVAAGFGAVVTALLMLVAELFGRREFDQEDEADWTWWAVAFLGAWLALRGASAYWAVSTLDSYSILPCLLCLVLFLFGWHVFRWAWPSIMFLFFMMPLPTQVASGLRDPLQTISTKLSVGVIQTLGIAAGSSGHVIRLSEGRELEVAAACSGLRMMMLFFTICVGGAFVMRRPLWERIVVVLSAIPIAVLANVARVSATAACYQYASPEWGEWVHDMAGLFMMPLGLLMLLAELTLLSKLFIDPDEDRPLAVGRSTATGGSTGEGGGAVAGRRGAASRRGGALAGNLFAATMQTNNPKTTNRQVAVEKEQGAEEEQGVENQED